MENKTLLSEITQTLQSLCTIILTEKSETTCLKDPTRKRKKPHKTNNKGFLITLAISIFVCLIRDALMNPGYCTFLLRIRRITLGIQRVYGKI